MDAAIATEVLQVEESVKKKRIGNVYKVRGAIWGTMLKQTESGEGVLREVFNACEAIVEKEKRDLQECNGLALVSQDELDEARSYIDMVTCDLCL